MKAIGDNLIQVARSKRYTAKQFRELFLWAIGDTDTPPVGLEEAADFIAADQRGLETRLAQRKAANAERQARFRRRGADNANNASNASNADNGHQPAIPTIPTSQSNNASVISARAHEPPSLTILLAWAADTVTKPNGKAIPADFAREWFNLMEQANPPWTNTRGRKIAGNWKNELYYAWKREQEFAAKPSKSGGTNQPNGVIHHEEGYTNPL